MGEDDEGHKYSVLYENGKAYHYTVDGKGKVQKGKEYDGKNGFISQAVSDLNSIASTAKGKGRVNDLQGSGYGYGIGRASGLRSSRFSFDEKQESGGTIYYHQGGGFLLEDGVSYDKSYYLLGHEMQHAWDRDQGKSYYLTEKLNGKLWSKTNAVAFENYLRAMGGEQKMRTTYNRQVLFENSSPEYFKNLPRPLRKTEEYYLPSGYRAPGSDATYVAPNYKPIRRDSRSGKFISGIDK
jgi:hypothetical protein